jgi:hypothetical protein
VPIPICGGICLWMGGLGGVEGGGRVEEATTGEWERGQGGGGGTLGRDVRPAHRVRDCPNE